MSDENSTFSVGVINGGEWVNCVSSTCDAEVISMAKKQKNLDEGIATILAMNKKDSEIKFYF